MANSIGVTILQSVLEAERNDMRSLRDTILAVSLRANELPKLGRESYLLRDFF